MRQEQGMKTKYPGIYSLSDGTYRVVAKAIDPKTEKPRYRERYTREVDPKMALNGAVGFRAQLIKEITLGTKSGDVPTEISRLDTLCSSSWITFVTTNVRSEARAEKLGKVIENYILDRWGDYLIDKITVPEIDAWVRELAKKIGPETIRHYVGLFRRILSKARGQYQLPPIDWDLITLPSVTSEHAEKNRLDETQIATVLPILPILYPYYAPEIFALYSLGVRYCHVSGTEWAKLSSDGVIEIDRSYDYAANTFGPVDARKKAPPQMALEPRTLELVRRHRRFLMAKNHPGLKAGLLFPSEAGTRPVGNDQLNDVWREAQAEVGIEHPVSIHGLRHTFHDIARRQGIPDAVVKAMAGRAGVEVARGSARRDGKHLHYSRGVTIEEMLQASMAVMSVVPTAPISRDGGRDERGRDRTSDDEAAEAAGT